MNNDNLRRVHKTLLDNGYTPPTYEEFENDMQDDNNLRGVYETLKKEGYTPPEYEQFKSDMGFAKVDANPNVNANGGANADADAKPNGDADPNLNANPNAKPWEAKVAGVPSLYDIADKQREETPKMPNYRHEVSVDEEGGKISKPVVKMSAIGNTPQVAPVFKDYAGNEYDATDPKVLEEAKRQVTPIVNTPKAQEEPSLLESIGKSIGAGAVRAGTQMIDVLQQLSSNMYVEDPSSPTGFTRTQSYEEQIKDENNPLTQASSAGHTLADKWSKEAQPRQGKGFVDLIMDGDITGALQKGVATAGESLPTTLSWATPYTAILNAIGMAGGNYREYTLEDESIPAWKRASMAIGSAAFEQAVEKYADPIFKYIGGTKVLKGAAKEASKEIVEEVTKNATETLAKRIYKGLVNVGKDALGEGAEEVVTTFGNDALGEVLDYVEGNTDYGVRAQWEKLKKENPNANLWDFSKQKAKEYGDSFFGGYLSGAYTSGTAQVTTKALQYATGAASEIDIEGKRGTKIVPPVMDVAQAFDNGYSLEGQEMNDAMNMYDMQREKAVQVLGEDKVAELDANPVDAMAGIDTEEQLQVATDYVNAKATFDGMGQKVLDDINAQIAESEKNLNELTSKTDGKIHPVTLKGERKAHIVDGNVAVTDNGEIDAANSDLSILVRDDETGKIEFVSPSDIVTSDGAIDAEEEKANVAQTIRDAVTQQADAQMNGILSFNVGDEYDVLDDEGNAHTIAVVDNGQEGQVLVSVDGENVARMMPREEVQKMANNANLARLAEHEAKKETKKQMGIGETSGEADNNNVGANEPLAATPDAMPMIKNSEDPDFMATTPERGHRYLYDEAGIPKAAADNMVTAHINAAEKEVKKQSDALAKLDANPGTSISAYKAKQADIKGKLDAAQAAYDYWNGVKTEQGKRDEAELQAAFAAQTADASGRQNELAAQKTPNEKIDAAKQMYGEYFDSDFTVPYDAMELVAMNMPNEKISWEGREGVRGLQQELGSNFKRGVGRDKGTNAFNIYLAKKGEGISTDEAIHSIYESAENTLPNGEHRWDVEEIRGAFIDMFMSAEKPSDIRDYVLNNRIRQAEQMRAAEDEAAEMARLDDEIMQRTGMEREEYAAWIAELEARADAQAAYENEVYNETKTSNDRETEGSIGEEGSGQGQGQEGDTTGVEEDGAAGVAEGGRNEGTQGDTTERQEGDLAQAKVTARLSSEVNEFDKPFVLASNGTTTFGEVSKDSGLTEAPIKLSLGENRIDEEGGNHGYGLLHIEAGHGEQIRAAGFNSVEEFVETVAKNYDTIREGGIVANNQTYLLEISDEHNNTLFIQLSRDGKYWNVNSAGIFKKKYSRRKQEVYTRPALEPGTNTDSRGVDSGLSDGVTAPAGNSPETSASKGTENSETDKETEQKFNKGERFLLASGAVITIEDVDENGVRTFTWKSINNDNVHTSKATIEELEVMGAKPIESTQEAVSKAEEETDTNPTEGQKKAGNYKKGHIKIDSYDVSIEQPKGSVRSGVDANGKKWEQTMNNTYGYIRGTEGVDGDHIDVFLSDNLDDWNGMVYVVDQVNNDGSFDEHKVMYGFNSAEEARAAYLSNYEEGWQGLGTMTGATKEEFKKWVNSSHRKTKPFAEYKSVQKEEGQNESTINGAVDKVEKAKPQKSEKKSSARASSVGKIDDFGEKIGGARKDLARGRIRDIKGYTTKDLTTLKKGADDILSQANILRLYKDGQMDEQTARGFLAMNNAVKVAIKKYGRTAREIILNKYRDAAVAWEEGRAAEFGITDADVAAYMAGFDITEEKARKDLDYCITETFDMYMLTYQAMNYPAVERKLGQYVIVDYGSMRSRRIPLSRPFWVKTSYTSGRGYPFATLEGAMEKLNQLCPEVKPKDTEKKEKGEKAEHGLRVTKEGFGFYVKSRNIPGNIYLSPKFTSEKQAQAYMEENLEQLKAREQRLVDALMGSNIGMAEREGVDYRNGKDVTPQDFLDEFGFRGVEFGNWVPQGERQMYLNKTYDAIKDFCAIVGISPKAFSLGGRLGLAFGARGSGRALAHYEPGKEAINLTRMSGVGSLAHEWFHALDNILAKQETGNTSDMATMRYDVVREEVSAVLKEMYRVMKAMDYDMRSRRAGEYWGRTEEEFARLFENYIYNKLAEKEVTSPILVRKDILFDDAEEVSKNRWPYPSVAENATMAPLFDKLFSTIQEKTDEKGNVVLFQKLGGSTLRKEADATEMMMRDALIETMEGAGIEVVTDVAIGQQVLDENANATREMRVYHGSGADFDAFDHSHMGEGEGAQAYGWGTYVTEVEGIGKTYAQSVGQNPIGRRPVLYKGESYDAVNTDGWSDEKKGVYVDLIQGMRVMGKSAEQAKDDLRLMTEVNIRNRERSLANLKVSSETYQSIAEDKRKQEERLKHINEFNADDFTREGSTPTLYTVEIPEENAAYYIGYNERMREQQEIVEMADNELAAQGWRRQEIGEQMVFTNSEGKRIVFTANQTGADFYEEFVVALGSKKAASEFLSSVGITGIKYPAEFRSGGRTDGASNYVIFDESDIEITNKARLFRTSNGEVYGYTMGGKIYLDTRIATTETPIHEYSHLWSEALEQANPKAWEQLKNDLVKDTELMDYVKGLYPEIEDENELMHEVFAHFSGKRGRARLEEMRKEEIEKANGLLDKARIIAMFHRLKELLGRYWTMARDLFAGSVKGLKKMKAEDFADMAMADLMGGFNPSAAAKNNDIWYQFVGEQGATEADKAEGVITRIESLATAKQMEADGRPAINIKMATGWERGKDGKWRYETEDFDVSHDSWEKAWEMGDGEYVLLPELIGKDDILFKEYPDLANVKVYPNRRISEGGYYSHPNEIHVSAKNTDNVKIFRSTLLHEVQHAIQHREGFERGTNWEKYTLDASADELHIAYLIREEAEKLVDSGEYKRLGNAINHVASLWEENGWYNPRVDKDGFYYAIGLAHDYEADLLNEMSLPKAQYEAKEKYLRNAGEVEARNVQTRASMTAKERRRTLAEETEDYLRGEQIVTNGDAGGSASVVEDKDEVARLEAEQGAAEAVKMHYDALAQKYHGKPYRIVMSIDEMADEDFLKEIGITDEELAKLTRDEIRENAKEQKEYTKAIKIGGGYNPNTGKIVIFAENIPSLKEIEDTFFHENLHGILHELYGDNPQSIALRFWDAAEKWSDKKSIIAEAYRNESEHRQKEEFFVYLLSRAMLKGRVDDVLSVLTEEDAERIENILGILGYDRQTEELDRRREKGNDRENHGQAQEKLGQDVQADRHRRTVDVAQGGKLYRQPAFYSNAERAVEGIKQEKATPEQWLAMTQKAGGLKAGEDKWMGLSDWLRQQGQPTTDNGQPKAKTLTKQEVLDFIRSNRVEVEDVNYAEESKGDETAEKEFFVFTNDTTAEAIVLSGKKGVSLSEASRELLDERYGEGWEDYVYIDSMGFVRKGEFVTAEEAAQFFGVEYDKAAERAINSTRIDYTTEGLENKREIALVVPSIEPWNESDEIHFGDAGGGRAIAWIRFGETTDADGKRVLVIDEIQSKRHQEGRENGYSDSRVSKIEKRIEELQSLMASTGITQEQYEERDQLKKELDNIVVNSNPELKEVNEVLDEKQKRLDELKYEDANKGIDERVQLLQLRGRQDEVRNVEEYDLLESEINSLEESINNRKEEIKRLIADVGEYNYRYDFLYRDAKRKLAFGIPDAPFDKNWHELAMKRMLRYAAENGYDKIAWTKGAQQADRYNLSKVFNSIEREDNPNEEGKRFVFSGGNYEVMRVDDSNKVIYSSIGESEGKNLGELVGKDLAIKMMGMEDGDAIDSEEIRIGGEGMMAFYDQMLPRFMDKYGKKWGVKTTEVELPEVEEAGETMWAVDVTPEMRESVMEGQPMFREGGVLPTYEESLASSKAAGYTKRQHDAWWNRAHKNMRLRANEIAKKLHLEGVVDIYETADDLNGVDGITEEDKKSKGWYDPKTGRIAIILGNHASAYDVMMTMLHEGVAHFGLRQLFGKNFETFLWNVYSNATPEVRSEINKLMAKNGWNYETATEEYLAGLAEDIDFDRVMKSGWWWKIKDWFVKMLRDIGLGSYVPEGKISDNELRYVLWRSYYNLELGGAYGTLLGAAIDVAKQYELGVGKFAPKEEVLGVAESGIGMSLEETNRRFNDELQQQIDGTLPKDHVYYLGMPSEILLSTGIEDVPIYLSASRLNAKSSQYDHDFEISEIKDLVKSINTPIAVFSYGDKSKAQNIIIEVQHEGKNFVVGISIRPSVGGRVLEINSIRNVFPKDNAEWLNWINQGKLLYVDKEKIQTLINQQRTNLAEVDYLDLDSAAKVVENFVNPKISAENVEKNAEKLHRSGDGTPRAMARDTYERLVMSGTQQFREAVQDSMLSLKNLYKSILQAEGKEKHIKDVAGYENAYLAENRMHSASQAQISAWTQDFFTPIVEEVYRLVGDSKSAYEELNDYLMAKHGLERNIVLAERDARKKYDELVKAGQPADLNSLIKEYREKDYSGLTALTGESNTADAELLAQQMVDDFEASHDTTELWARINAATKSSLEKMFRSGLMSKARYEDIRDMFAYYIPLQGFDEKVAEDMYAYVGSDGTRMYGTPIRSARGRRSKADNPLATIAMNGEAAIRQGNRNEMKQHFLNFVQAHPSDVVSVSDVWLRYNDVTDEWEQYFDAGLKDDDSPEEVERKVRDFNERMEQLAASNPDRYKRGRDAEDIPFRVVSMSNASQHQVIVKRGGKTIVLTINGNPRAAQALNGLTNPDVFTEGVFGKAMNIGQNLNRLLSSLYTTRNPEFVASNYTRDALYSNCMTWVKESPAYAFRFHKNFGMANPAFMAKMFVEWENGELRKKVAQMGNTPKQGSVDYMRKQFYDFMMNGGETGWTSLRDIEAHKKDLEASLKKEGSTSRKAWKALGGTLDIANRAVENCARFSAFVTSREMGRSLERSIYDAKEVSVNFNKKGAGDKFLSAKGQTKLGKTGSVIGGLGRGLFVFFNAGVQGMANYMGAAKHNPAKLAVLSTLLFGLGSIIPIVTANACGGDDDDEDSYYNLPEYVRRSNICFRWRKDMPWIKIPLPIEFRAMYGLGELSCGVLTGKERYTDEELTKQYISQISQVLPLDFMEGGGGWHAFVPSSVKPGVEAYTNKGWTGLPIYKDNKFKEHYPQWTRAYDSADKTIVEATRWLNEATGGSDVSQGMIDWNPARIEYMLKGYLGGYYTMFDRLKKSAETAFGKREFEWRNVPIASRFVQEGDERTEARKAKSEYFDLHDEYEKTKSDMNGFKKIAESGRDDAQEYAERLSDLENSQRYVHFQIMENYKPILDAYNGMIKEAEGEYKEELKAEQDALRRELIELIHAVDDEKEVNIEEQIKGDLDVLSQSEHKEIKKAVGSVMAKQLGGKYRSSTTEYGKAYEKIRNLEDLTEDLQMQIAIGEAEDSDDVRRKKSLEKARNDINALKKRLGDPDKDDEKTMRDIRKKRRDALKRFGKKSKE